MHTLNQALAGYFYAEHCAYSVRVLALLQKFLYHNY